MPKTHLATIDLGATSGRVMVGSFSPSEGVELNEIHRFPNQFNRLHQNDYWDMGMLWREASHGLREAKKLYPELRSVGVDSWGADQVMLNADGRLAFPVHSYRDERTRPWQERIENSPAAAQLFQQSGLPPVNYNTGLQLAESLATFPLLRDMVDRVLSISDYFNFLLSGELVNEFSQASTTMLLDPRGEDYHPAALEYFGIPPHWFTPPHQAKQLLGPVRLEGLGDVDTVLVPGHDTSCAVEAIPGSERGFIVSSGTWMLAGQLTDGPLLSDAAFRAWISNERTGSGAFRPCKVMLGLWLIEQIIPCFERRPANDAEWTALIDAASDRPSSDVHLDTSDRALFNPTDMREAIDTQLRHRGGTPPLDLAGYVRLVCDSLGAAIAGAVDAFGTLSGQRAERIIIVGGGARNRLLCQAMANAAALPVTSYQLEATCLGNLAYQACALGLVPDLAAFHAVIAPGLPTQHYAPRG